MPNITQQDDNRENFNLRSAPGLLASPLHHAIPTEVWSPQVLCEFSHLEQNGESRSKPKGPLQLKNRVAGILMCILREALNS